MKSSMPAVGVCLGVLLTVSCGGGKSTPAGVIIESPGTYKSPDGTRSVRIWEEDGHLIFALEGIGTSGPETVGPSDVFPKQSGWFATWDGENRLWTYVPSDAVRWWYVTNEASGSGRAGERGTRFPIPEPFLERLPSEVRDQIGT